MGNLSDRAASRKRFLRSEDSLHKHLLSDYADWLDLDQKTFYTETEGTNIIMKFSHCEIVRKCLWWPSPIL